MPLISVIIPVYNGENTIRETIVSVLNQTFSDLEVIVINDGSQDSTLEIISSIRDSRLKVFSYPNANQAVSRNRGIALACGEYISFIDADDLWTPDKLEAQFNALQEHPQADVAYSWTNCIDEAGKFLRRGYYISVSGNVYKKLLLNNFLENGSNPLIRRHALAEVGGFEPSVVPAEDWDMYLRLANRYQFVGLAYPQILYRISPNSTSTNVSKMERGCLQVIERNFSQVPESLQYLKCRSLANLYKILTHRAIEGVPQKERGLAAIRYLRLAVKNDPSLLQAKVIWKVLFKVALFNLLPTQQADAFLTRFNKLSDTSTLFGYLQLDC
ncbi:MAG TPA: glycosyl transferase family A [Cyanobacteria bacterium UBA12227]|nr:glycosyl transferase family A [Cyanobacteria bacterium UBA12227]HAX89501.1 glycosyl transferase family A [Cyanobacteria bacterium UBA11370]HBY81617.1 glycosyl transferase family A [Cyanobacteria bacterium UBA11148]